MARQMSFFKPTVKEFGGSLSVKGKRKIARILDSRKPLHFVLKSKNSANLFSQALTGVISQKLGKGLWILKPYSRVVTWGRDFLSVLDYILLNDCEVSRIVPYAMRGPRRNPPP